MFFFRMPHLCDKPVSMRFSSLFIVLSIGQVHSAVNITNKADYCSEANGGVHLSPGVNVTLICDVENPGVDSNENTLTWVVPSGGNRIINLASFVMSGINGPFTAQVISVNDTTLSINAILSFVTIKDLDNKVIECRDNIANLANAFCTLLILSKYIMICLDV